MGKEILTYCGSMVAEGVLGLVEGVVRVCRRTVEAGFKEDMKERRIYRYLLLCEKGWGSFTKESTNSKDCAEKGRI